MVVSGTSEAQARGRKQYNTNKETMQPNQFCPRACGSEHVVVMDS